MFYLFSHMPDSILCISLELQPDFTSISHQIPVGTSEIQVETAELGGIIPAKLNWISTGYQQKHVKIPLEYFIEILFTAWNPPLSPKLFYRITLMLV